MHELGLCEAVLDAVTSRAQGRPVTRIVVRAGILHRVAPEAFQQAFTIVAAGTEAEDAQTSVVTVLASVRCDDCGAATESGELLAVCPRCGSTAVMVSGGDELVLESIEYAASAVADDSVRA